MAFTSTPNPAKPAAYNVNASSMLSLLSEVSRHSDGHKKGQSKPSTSFLPNNSSASNKGKPKSSIFDRANRGIEARSARDRSHMLSREELSVEARRVLESREKLEKKAILYEKLARGETIKGVSRDQLREGLLVDFETKAVEEAYASRNVGTSSDDDSDSDEDDSNRVPQRPQQHSRTAEAAPDDDDLVEIVDDLGRTRWVRKSTLAAQREERQSVMDGGVPIFSDDIKLASASWHPADNQNTYYGEQREFHVYQPSEEEILARRKALNLDAPLAAHFDSTKEIRNRGAGFIQLSGDEETRKKQMEQLMSERESTERAREKIDKEGDAIARRDKELLERKRLIEDKKRKLLEKRRASELESENAKKKKVE
ncbi:MAG: hypothetical protein CYPHOPRED_001479 [Cyphobasidiales sp. Tagirdzhanova-0007]|nr:MAG: hypothetical protein CYPHOPRED_001479 [Cyphobasidiales sp. Tagirdzhanova-0007]